MLGVLMLSLQKNQKSSAASLVQELKFENIDEWVNLPFPIIGVDEVGRGCLAGRVYAGAVCLNAKAEYSIYKDSKKIAEHKRDAIAEQIIRDHKASIAYAEVEEIESINILHAALLAMQRAVIQLIGQYPELKSGLVLVDGNKLIKDLPMQQAFVIKGDQKVRAISAASIIAKVERDNYIKQMAQQYPEYNFEKNKAYATEDHRSAIAMWGPSPIHRRSFAGVKEFCINK